MTKKKYTAPHAQIRNDVLLNLCRAKLKINHYRFLMVLFAETFGKKNMRMYTGKARGKYMPWEPSVWIENGFDKSTLARIKAELLSLRVIRQARDKIGFNWHYHQWKCNWYVDHIVNSRPDSQQEGRPDSQQEYPQQSTVVDQAVNETGDSAVTSTDLQTVKKEERRSKDKGDGAKAPHGVSLKEEKSDPIFDGFSTLWNKYFKHRAKRTENFKSALHEYRKLVDGEDVTVDEVYAALVRFKKTQERKRVDYEYYPMLKNWLKGEEWIELRKEKDLTWIDGQSYTPEDLERDNGFWNDWLELHGKDLEPMSEDYMRYRRAIRRIHFAPYLQAKQRRFKNEQTQ